MQSHIDRAYLFSRILSWKRSETILTLDYYLKVKQNSCHMILIVKLSTMPFASVNRHI
jgi:hypothetical protein